MNMYMNMHEEFMSPPMSTPQAPQALPRPPAALTVRVAIPPLAAAIMLRKSIGKGLLGMQGAKTNKYIYIHVYIHDCLYVYMNINVYMCIYIM